MNAPTDPQLAAQVQQIQRTQLQQLATLVNIGLTALSDRFVVVLALLLETGIFAWAVYQGGWDRIAAATLFSIGAWFLANYRTATKE